MILFQAARELLVNVAKHAQTKQATVILKGSEDGCDHSGRRRWLRIRPIFS